MEAILDSPLFPASDGSNGQELWMNTCLIKHQIQIQKQPQVQNVIRSAKMRDFVTWDFVIAGVLDGLERIAPYVRDSEP